MTEMTPEHCEAQQRRWAEEDRDVWHELAVLESRIEALDRPPCKWTEDEDGIWNTTCGNAYEFIVGGPEDNDARFCQYCGGSLAALAAGEEP